ncbi:protein-tyrosine-phosphatase [Entamoeba marina]
MINADSPLSPSSFNKYTEKSQDMSLIWSKDESFYPPLEPRPPKLPLSHAENDNRLPKKKCLLRKKKNLTSSSLTTYLDDKTTYDSAIFAKQYINEVAVITLSQFQKLTYDESIIEIIDCRYPYEYEKGHLKRSLNIWNEMLLMNHFFTPNYNKDKTILIFYCEFSEIRAPSLAKKLRQLDKQQTIGFTPLLYPNIYVIEGGFANIFQQLPHHCDGEYISMDNPSFKNEKKKFYHYCSTLHQTNFYSPRLTLSSFSYSF